MICAETGGIDEAMGGGFVATRFRITMYNKQNEMTAEDGYRDVILLWKRRDAGRRDDESTERIAWVGGGDDAVRNEWA
jgi:hypothetical protein